MTSTERVARAARCASMASASAKTDCTLMVFSRQEMEEAIRRDPAQAFDIIDGLLTRLAQVTDQLLEARGNGAED